MKTRLILIRHPHVGGNGTDLRARMLVWTDLPLSALGRRQIALLVQRFQQNSAVAAIYSSTLERAACTARALAELGKAPLTLDERLREIGCGQADGRAVDDVRTDLPAFWNANLRQDDVDFRWPGGESYREFRQRCLDVVQDIASRHGGRYVAIVTHAGVISQVIGWLHGISPARWGRFRPGNASVSELDWSGGSGAVLVFNDRSHLVQASAYARRMIRNQS